MSSSVGGMWRMGILLTVTACTGGAAPPHLVTGTWAGDGEPDPNCDICSLVFGLQVSESTDGTVSGRFGSHLREKLTEWSGAVYVSGRHTRDSLILALEGPCDDGEIGGLRGRVLGDTLWATGWQVGLSGERQENAIVLRRGDIDARVREAFEALESLTCQ